MRPFSFFLLLQYSLVSGDLASLYSIESPSLTEEDQENGVIGLTYKVSSRIQLKQLKVELYDYKCEDLLPNTAASGFQIGNLIKLPKDESYDDDDADDSRQSWMLPLQVRPPSLYQKLLQTWYSFQRTVVAAAKEKDYTKFYNETKFLYADAVGSVATAVKGNSQSSASACVRWMVYTMDPTNPHALEVTFERTQLIIHFQQQDDQTKIAHLDMQAKETPRLTVAIGKGDVSGETAPKNDENEQKQAQEQEDTISQEEDDDTKKSEVESEDDNSKEGVLDNQVKAEEEKEEEMQPAMVADDAKDVEYQLKKDDGTDAVGSSVDGAEEVGTSKDEL
jgi:hypothetical protein